MFDQRAYDKARYPKERARRIANAKRWREANPERIQELRKREYQNKKEEIKKRANAWHAANREHRLALFKIYRNTPAAKEAARQWRRDNPEKVRAWNRRRKAVKRAVEGSHTLKEWLDVLARFNHQCAHCGTKENLTQDHVIPITKGGTDYASNLQPLCVSCNSRKGNRTT